MRRLFILLLSTLLFSAAAAAQDATTTPTPDGQQNVAPEDLKGVPPIATGYSSDDRSLPDLGRVGVDMTSQIPLTVREAVALALENNKEIEVTRKTVRMAEFDVLASKGIYQPRLTGQSYYDNSTTPNVSIFSTNQTNKQGTLLGNAAVQGFWPKYGTSISGFFNNSGLTSNNSISVLSPQYNTGLGVILTQPLFRGRRFDQGRRTIEIAKANVELTDTQFRQRSIEVVAQVEKTYWDLTYALRNLQVQRDGVRDAKVQLEHNRRLVEEGQLAPIDIVAAETQVANFEQAVYDALNLVNQAENALKNLIAPNRTDAIWSQSVTPIDSVEVTTPMVTLDDATTAAFANRPELDINRSQKKINAIDRKLYRDQKKPQIDLIASYSSSGVGGNLNPDFNPSFPTPCNTDPSSPACAQQLANLAILTGNPYKGIILNRYPAYRVGVQFNIPLFGDKTASALLGKAKVEESRIETQREQIEQGIQVEVRNALQSIRSAEARLRAAAVARENSAKQYESEQRKLDAGQSDIYKVLERQTALTTARSNELRARTELNKAIAELDRATGNTLKSKDIETK